MVAAGLYEEALNICTLCRQPSQLKDTDVGKVHEKYAHSLFLKGDFDESISNYITAKTNPVQVLLLFPDFIPLTLQSSDRKTKGSNTIGVEKQSKLVGNVLHRAASAVVKFCEHHRPHV